MWDRPIHKDFDQNSYFQAACDTSIARVTGCVLVYPHHEGRRSVTIPLLNKMPGVNRTKACSVRYTDSTFLFAHGNKLNNNPRKPARNIYALDWAKIKYYIISCTFDLLWHFCFFSAEILFFFISFALFLSHFPSLFYVTQVRGRWNKEALLPDLPTYSCYDRGEHIRAAVTNPIIIAIYYVDSGLSFDASSRRKCTGGRTWPLRLEEAGPGEQGGGTSSARSFWLLGTSFHASIWMLLCSFSSCLDYGFWHSRYIHWLSDGK